ncbi:1-acyl-sn-glycerol-3-phosphate acyltransferase [Motilibacter rhizosphaerae]|uniref:1-acyl-sn-glycerol-3-phosphate acyltransferase n=1 Tax=Motilibacter rhizosphaerae TaxID=598652 RepID=A0A4Q7NP37_9ACTN|nr:lysophospholipid acyltransferase family protein [Motilibacter rhizosphaerae]RZS87034.1 1-acyl-sn-glycerol-3-phosphate acyltransferase [Motilibacter rhizosphaerae]
MLYPLVRAVLTLARLVYRPRVEGRDNVPLTGPVILASNHLSFLDSIVIPLMAPRDVAFLAKAEYFTGPGKGVWFTRAFFSALQAIPVQRHDTAAATRSLHSALEVLQQGGAFGIYPEGTRSRDGRLYKGRAGVAWLALESGAPVVPVAVLRTDQLLPVGAKVPRFVRITVRFGTSLCADDLPPGLSPAELRRAFTDRVMDEIAALSGQQRADAYAGGSDAAV